MSAHTIPHVQVSLTIDEQAEPLVIVLFNRLPDRAELHVSASGMDREQLAATFRVLAKSIEDDVPYEEVNP
jgi:hypothetical protein